MDVFAHILWSYILFHSSGYVWLAVLFGILPDLLSWTIFMFYPHKSGFNWKNPDFSRVPKWVFTLYGVTHSLFVIAAVFIAVFLIFKTIPIYLLAWPLHVLVDIPTHRRDFLPTPLLWPFSDYAFPGISWANRYFMVANYSLIALFLVYINSNDVFILLNNAKEFFKELF